MIARVLSNYIAKQPVHVVELLPHLCDDCFMNKHSRVMCPELEARWQTTQL